jgi:hypothetical protein
MRIVSGASTAETVFFMDGPYVIELSAKDQEMAEVHFFEDRPGGRKPRGFITSCSMREILQNAIDVLEQMQRACQEKGWQVDPSAVSAKLKEGADFLKSTPR